MQLDAQWRLVHCVLTVQSASTCQ